MGLGNNRDYTARDRNARRNLSVVKTRTAQIQAAEGLDPIAAYAKASTELREGKLRTQIKAWVDPILAHKRAMRAKYQEMN